MAKIVKININKNFKNVKNNITNVEMDITLSSNGELMILETFGSTTRKVKGKASQIIHLDKKHAKELMEIINKWI